MPDLLCWRISIRHHDSLLRWDNLHMHIHAHTYTHTHTHTHTHTYTYTHTYTHTYTYIHTHKEKQYLNGHFTHSDLHYLIMRCQRSGMYVHQRINVDITSSSSPEVRYRITRLFFTLNINKPGEIPPHMASVLHK